MAIEILKRMIQYPTVTPLEHNIYSYIRELLPDFEAISIEKNGVKNLFLYKIPQGYTERQAFDKLLHFCFAGHIDVVPPGGGADIPDYPLLESSNTLDTYDKGGWIHNPFAPIIQDGYIYGRGTQDMKGGIACFIKSIQQFLQSNILNFVISVLLTSDEEGDGIYGTRYMLEILKDKKMIPTHSIVAEPTNINSVGDTIKVGRRGSINGVITIQGKQGHVAYPEKCINPVELLGDRLGQIAGYNLDNGDEYFSSSKIVITDIRGGIEAVNVTPNDLKIMFNVRNSTITTIESIRSYIDSVLQNIPYNLSLNQSSKSFITKDPTLANVLKDSVKKITNLNAELSTSGGTSDARFFSEYGTKVVEFGVCNDRIHAINERVSIDDIENLCKIFFDFLINFNEL